MTDALDFPERVGAKPLWLVTLADLALLLVGFLVLLQATHGVDRGRLAQGLRQRFGADAAAAAAEPPPAMPVAAVGIMNFAPGSAALPSSAAGLVAWAREAGRDPRVGFTVAGSVDGSPSDVDPASGNAAILAIDRARVVAAALAGTVPAGRLSIATAARPGRRAALVTLAFAGEALQSASPSPPPSRARRPDSRRP